MTWGRESDGNRLARGVVMIGGTLSNCIVKGGGGPPGSSRLVHCTSGGLITDCHIGPNVSFPDKGGGVYLTDSELRNSTISGMFSGSQYGGAYDGAGVYAVASTVSGCTITGNWARRAGGGAYFDGCEVDRCIIASNTAGLYLDAAGRGGGVFATNSVIRNSRIAGNYASSGYDPETGQDGGLPGLGGGLFLNGSSLVNCTVTGNRTTGYGPDPAKGGGIYVESGNVRNSIIYFNAASSGTNWYWNDPLFPIQQLQLVGEAPFTYSCTTPDPGGVGLGNIVEDPQFFDRTNGNYRLGPTSPCIDAGLNEAWMSSAYDLDGNSRIHNGTVDMGAWESTNASPIIGSQPLVQFAPPQANNGFIRSLVEGLPGQGTLIVESSSDLIEWQPIRTNSIPGDSFELVEPISPSSPQQFFRALITY
jgi:hypothetical protein